MSINRRTTLTGTAAAAAGALVPVTAIAAEGISPELTDLIAEHRRTMAEFYRISDFERSAGADAKESDRHLDDLCHRYCDLEERIAELPVFTAADQRAKGVFFRDLHNDDLGLDEFIGEGLLKALLIAGGEVS